MSTLNPYQSPTADLYARPGSACVRDGDAVFVPHGSDLPPRCIRCNAPSAAPIKTRKLYWHTPWLYLLIFVGLLVYAIVALIARKRIDLSPGLCLEHLRARRIGIAIGFGAMLAALVGMFVALSYEQGGLAGVLGVAAFIAMIVTAFRARLVRATRIDEYGARVVGFGAPFLAALPRR